MTCVVGRFFILFISDRGIVVYTTVECAVTLSSAADCRPLIIIWDTFAGPKLKDMERRPNFLVSDPAHQCCGTLELTKTVEAMFPSFLTSMVNCMGTDTSMNVVQV